MPKVPHFMATEIGSMPFMDPEYTVSVEIDNLPESPFWPQLPKTDLREQMEIQYSEGMPRAVVDSEKNECTSTSPEIILKSSPGSMNSTSWRWTPMNAQAIAVRWR